MSPLKDSLEELPDLDLDRDLNDTRASRCHQAPDITPKKQAAVEISFRLREVTKKVFAGSLAKLITRQTQHSPRQTIQ